MSKAGCLRATPSRIAFGQQSAYYQVPCGLSSISPGEYGYKPLLPAVNVLHRVLCSVDLQVPSSSPIVRGEVGAHERKGLPTLRVKAKAAYAQIVACQKIASQGQVCLLSYQSSGVTHFVKSGTAAGTFKLVICNFPK